jgi:mRNA interferase MazF
MLELFRKFNVNEITNIPTEIEIINKRLSYELETVLQDTTINMFARRCNLLSTIQLEDILNLKLTQKPSRELLRIIASNSNGNVTYRRLYEICNYSEFDEEEDKRWLDFKPKRGQIYYIDLGFSIDSEQSGVRPCLILQNDVGNDRSTTLVVLPISTRLKKFGKTHVRLTRENGLREESYILAEQIRVVSKRRIYYSGCANLITTLSEEKMEEVRVAVEFELGLEDLSFNEEKAYILANAVRTLKRNIKVKQSRDLIDIYKEKYNEFISYCKKFNRDPEVVYSSYKTLDIQYA